MDDIIAHLIAGAIAESDVKRGFIAATKQDTGTLFPEYLRHPFDDDTALNDEPPRFPRRLFGLSQAATAAV
ncbi:hypothetical protein [Xanthomonas albilineans]|uniref:hypothetical protein n=1 Tax=Xanthomonas albilineans TaxID=29447 RepID=UPI0005F327BC|nr:hypothetical protein [Xanthomonas albilineans]